MKVNNIYIIFTLIFFTLPITNGISQISPLQSTELEYKVNQGDSREYNVKKYLTSSTTAIQNFIDEEGNAFNVTFDPGLRIKVIVVSKNSTSDVERVWVKYEFNGRKTEEAPGNLFIIPTTDNRSYWKSFEKESESYTLEGDNLIYEVSDNSSSFVSFNKYIHNINDGWLVYVHIKSTSQNGTITQEIEWEVTSNSNDILINMINLSVEAISFVVIISVSLLLGISLAFILKKLKKNT